MSELHPTPDEIEAQLSPESKIRLVEMRAWTALEIKRLGIDSDTPE